MLLRLCQHSRAAKLCERNARLVSHTVSSRFGVANAGEACVGIVSVDCFVESSIITI